jgi:hypothetical protein
LLARIFLPSVVLLIAAAPARAQQAPLSSRDLAGCYELTPSVWSTSTVASRFELDTLGRMRPEWSSVFIPRSLPGSHVVGDTLVLNLSDGLSGWVVRLQRSQGQWSGEGEAVVDHFEADTKPVRQRFVLRSRSCVAQPDDGW